MTATRLAAMCLALAACWSGAPYPDTHFVYVRAVPTANACQRAVLQTAMTDGILADVPADDGCAPRQHGSNHWYCRFTAAEARVAGLRETLTKLGTVCAVDQ
jgi:hypothetical protein